MKRYCFVHAADLHLDTPFEGLRRAAPWVHAELLEASLEAWDALVELVLERDARFLLLAGDIYDGAERGLRAQLRFLAGLRRLDAAGVPVFVVHGNHDPVDEGWSAIRGWPPGVSIFSSEAVESCAVEHAGRRIATIHGRSYAQRETRENLALDYRRGPEPGLHIGLLHCNVGGHAGAAAGHANYSPCSIDDLVRAGMDYWALGHVHVHSVLRSGEPWIVYPGNLQGRGPQPGELGAKGALVVEVAGDRIAGIERVALDRIRFVVSELEVADCRDLAELESELASLAEAEREAADGRGLLMRVRLTGRSDLFADLRRPATLRDLLVTLRDRFEGATPLLWWDSLLSDVRPALELAEVRERDDFSAELLALREAVAGDPQAVEAFLAEALGGLPARQRGVEVPGLDASQHAALLDEAEELALELLLSAGERS